MLIGHEGIATALTTRLRERGAVVARQVEEIQGLPAGTIETPEPQNTHPVWIDVVSKGKFPTWMVVAADTPLRRTAGKGSLEGQQEETYWRYPFIIMSHVVGRDEQAVALARYRLMLVVRVLLLQDVILTKDVAGGSKSIIQTEDMQEIVSGTAADGESRYLAEGRNEFHIQSTEWVPSPVPAFGSVEELNHRESIVGRE